MMINKTFSGEQTHTHTHTHARDQKQYLVGYCMFVQDTKRTR